MAQQMKECPKIVEEMLSLAQSETFLQQFPCLAILSKDPFRRA